MNIETLREICLALPGTTEDVKWGADLCFCVGAKMYCVTGIESPSFGATLKVTPEQFDDLIQTDSIIAAPYLARYKWIGIQSATRFTDAEWKHYLEQSYQLVRSKLPNKIQAALPG